MISKVYEDPSFQNPCYQWKIVHPLSFQSLQRSEWCLCILLIRSTNCEILDRNWEIMYNFKSPSYFLSFSPSFFFTYTTVFSFHDFYLAVSYMYIMHSGHIFSHIPFPSLSTPSSLQVPLPISCLLILWPIEFNQGCLCKPRYRSIYLGT